MDCTPTPLAIPAPALATAPVQQLLADFPASLPWLSHPYGLVQTGQRVVDQNRTERFPQLYQQDGTGQHLDVRPDAAKAAVAFFERTGMSRFAWDDGAEGIAGQWTHPLALVTWCNLPRIDHRGYDFTEELARDVVRALLAAGLEVEVAGIEFRPEEVFRPYTWQVSQKQLLMYPYSAFRIPFAARTSGLPGCDAPFTVERGPEPCPPNLRG